MHQVSDVRNLISEIGSLIDQRFSNLQSWESLTKWEVGTSKKLDGTINTKIIGTEKHMRFITQIPPLESFERHWHDCSETCIPLCGILGDKDTGNTWSVNEQAVFSKGQQHTPWNPSSKETLFLQVDFYK
jgi:hypothetical protein